MSRAPIRVGLVGASIPRNGWAVRAHAPTIAELPGFVIHAVATTRTETAQQASRELGAPLAFTSGPELAWCDEVDLVVVGVRVLDHADIVRAALTAGKHVLCEWPLGVGHGQAAELAALARTSRGVNAIGLQARASPSIRHAAQLVRAGFIGEVQSALLVASNPQPGGRELPKAWAWHAERENWLSPLTIPGGHALDALGWVTRAVVSVSAEVATLNPQITLTDGNTVIRRTADDHVSIVGRLAGGALMSAQINGGADGAVGTVIEVRGSEGMLRIRTLQPTQLQMGSVGLTGARGGDPMSSIRPPDRLTKGIPASLRGGPGENLSGLYLAVEAAIRGTGSVLADFDDAVACTSLIETIQRAGLSGVREIVGSPAVSPV